jgi:hypothetical protein
LEPTTHKLEQNSKTKSEGQNKIQKKNECKATAKQQTNSMLEHNPIWTCQFPYPEYPDDTN